MTSVKRFDPSMALPIAVGLGLIKGMSSVSMFGRSNELDPMTETDIEPTAQTTYIFPPDSGQAMEVVSSSVSDTGVEITVQGLNADFDRIEDVVTINGTTPVALPKEYARVNSVFNSGSIPFVGDVRVRAINGGQVYSLALGRAQESNQAVYTVPRNTKAMIINLINSLQKSGGVEDDITVAVRYRRIGRVFRLPFDSGIQRSGDSSTEFINTYPQQILGPVDFKLSATSKNGGSVASARMSILLIDE